MTTQKEKATRIMIGATLVTLLLYVVIWSILNPAKFFAIWPVGNQAWAMVGFGVAGVVLFVSGLIGFTEIVNYARCKNCNIIGAYIALFFFVLVVCLLVIYGGHLYLQFILYSNNPDLQLFAGYTCVDETKLTKEFEEVGVLQVHNYDNGYYEDVDKSGKYFSNCGNWVEQTNKAVWNGTYWIEPVKHSDKAIFNGTEWIEPPIIKITKNETLPIIYMNQTSVSNDTLTEGTKLGMAWDGFGEKKIYKLSTDTISYIDVTFEDGSTSHIEINKSTYNFYWKYLMEKVNQENNTELFYIGK